MMNINCSEECIYEINGKCTLNHVTPLSNFSTSNSYCAYFSPKEKNKESSPEKK